jgi:hypothetical protein
VETVNVMDAPIDPRALLTTANLIDVGSAGDAVRRQMHGARTTFLRVFDVHVDAVPASAPAGLAAGEVRIVGTPASQDATLRAIAAAALLARGITLSGFSLADLVALAGDATQLRRLCARLKAAGLEAVAEVPIDGDLLADPVEAVLAARDAGLIVQRLTVSRAPEGERALGSGAQGAATMDVDGRLALVTRAAQLQDRAGGFRVFAPLPRTLSASGPTTGYADIKQVAVARTVVRNIASIQVDWALYGPKLAQVALTTGADDVDSVAAADPGTLGPRRSALEEIRNNIRAAGLEAQERTGRFEVPAAT